jgi:hypothetical protein
MAIDITDVVLEARKNMDRELVRKLLGVIDARNINPS